jgi:hypothetical protein
MFIVFSINWITTKEISLGIKIERHKFEMEGYPTGPIGGKLAL